MTTAVATRPSLVAKFAERYSVDPTKLMTTLKNTAFRQRGDLEVTDEQMMALLVVADQYGLNPFTREIFAYNDKGAIVPLVSVDGWLRIINEHPQFDGMDFNYSDEWETMPRGKASPTWIECVIYRRDRSRPTIVREYLDECYQAPRGEKGFDGPWQNVTKRFLRHRAIIQCGRVAFGFAGLQDSDEQQRIFDMGAAEEVAGAGKQAAVQHPQSKSEKTRALSEQVDADGVITTQISAQADTSQVRQHGRGRAQQAQQSAPAAKTAPAADREPGSDDEAAPAPSDSAMRILKTKLENAALGEADLRKKFGFGYEGVTTANFNDIVVWSEDPMGA